MRENKVRYNQRRLWRIQDHNVKLDIRILCIGSTRYLCHPSVVLTKFLSIFLRGTTKFSFLPCRRRISMKAENKRGLGELDQR